jgi:predicted GNAT family N-acyltransferase
VDELERALSEVAVTDLNEQTTHFTVENEETNLLTPCSRVLLEKLTGL